MHTTYQIESLEQGIAPGFLSFVKNVGEFFAGVYDGWNS